MQYHKYIFIFLFKLRAKVEFLSCESIWMQIYLPCVDKRCNCMPCVEKDIFLLNYSQHIFLVTPYFNLILIKKNIYIYIKLRIPLSYQAV